MRTSDSQPPVALVTGGAARIGAGIVRQLHHAGYNIILHYHHSQEQAETLCQELNDKRSASVASHRANLLDFADLDNLINVALEQWDKLDVLVNNASSFYPTPLHTIKEEQWLDLLGTNAQAPVFLCKACAPLLKQNKGCIVSVSDIAARKGRRDYLLYTMAKAALNNLTHTLAQELAPEVRVNAVAPGAILAPNFSNNDTNNNLDESDPLSISCLNYPGTVEDIANAVLFLISNTYTTGQVLNVDGGRGLKY